jgi:hypothetical protein
MVSNAGGLNVNLGLTEAQINNAIAVAVVEQMTPERQEAMIRDVVRAHLQVKTSQWDKETLLSKVVGEYVRSVAVDEVKQRITALEPRIRELVRNALGAPFEDSVLRQLQVGLANKVVASVSISADLGDFDTNT